jgi:hypothetical protein
VAVRLHTSDASLTICAALHHEAEYLRGGMWAGPLHGHERLHEIGVTIGPQVTLRLDDSVQP